MAIRVNPTDDTQPVSIPFKAIDDANKESLNTGTAVLTFDQITTISGNVFNDANGLSDNTVNGTSVNGTSVPQQGGSPVPVFVSLISNGSVVATVPVTASGAYSFSGVTNGTYSVVLTTNPSGSLTPSLPTSWTNTGENLGTGVGSDGVPNGTLPITVSGGTPVTDANFGIEQLPTAGGGSNTVANSGGTSPVTVPAATFTNTTLSSDVTPGTVASIRITGFPTNTTSLTINGTVYTPGSPEFSGNTPTGVVVPTDGSGNPTVPVLVDPTNDAGPVSIPFKAIDNAGKESTNTGTAVISSTPVTTVSGNVLNDANGLTDNTVNGTGVDGTSVPQQGGSPVPVFVSLISNGTIVATVPVTAIGSYSFTGVTNGSYSVVLTTNPAGSTTPSVPTSWTNTGENLGTGVGSDGIPNGTLPITVSGSPVTDANFGIEQLPTAGGGSNTVVNSGGTSPVTVPAATFTNTTLSSDPSPGSVVSIRITGFPTNTTSLTINGTVYTPGTFPAGGVVVTTDGSGNPNVPISVDPTNDAAPVSIPFKAIDNAGKESANTGTAVISSTLVLSIAGSVLNDVNGLTDNTVNGPVVDGTSVPQQGGSPVPVFVSLVSGSRIVATVPVTAAGTYSFPGVPNGSYSVVLTTNPAGSLTPACAGTSWTNTGENIGTTAGGDGST